MLNNHSWEEKGKKIYSAETLPEGWNWHVFTDYKACLKDPEGKTYYEIDRMIDDSYIHFTSYEGYLYGADSFVEAQREIEKLVSELLQKEQEEKINHSEDKKICPAEKLPEGWKWHIYNDGSGHLESPEGNHYCGFEMQMHGIEYKDLYTNDWNWTDQSFKVFQLTVEKKVEDMINELTILDELIEYNDEEECEFEI